MSAIVFVSETAAKATVLFAAAPLAALALRRASSAVRYFLWTAVLAAALVLPALSLLLPAWQWPAATKAVPSAALASPVVAGADVAAGDVAEVDVAAPAATANAPRDFRWLPGLWLAGVVLALSRLAVGHLQLAWSLRHARRVDAPFRLKSSRAVDVPLTCGVFSPVVVLPETSEDWGEERRRMVLSHELVHARRRDPMLWLLAQVAGALYWFHPLAWLAVSRFRREQERSCDDAVVREGAGCSAYAGHLVALARSVAPARKYAAALGMAATSDLEQRVRALLDPSRRRDGIRRGAAAATAAVLLAALLPLAAVHAQNSGQPVTLSGSVLDPSGAAVPHALVLLKTPDHQDAARTGDAGEYRFSVQPGSYTLQVRAQGFAEFQKVIVLPVSGPSNITLDLGAVSESMEVVGKAAAPAPPTSAPRRIRVGGNVQATKLVSMARPAYPPAAEAAGIEGTVLLRAVISMRGDLLGLSVMNTSIDGELAQAAMDAVKKWRYQPTLLNGAPVEVVTTIAVTFRLER